MVTSISTEFSSWEQAVQWLREQPEQQELVLAAYYDDPACRGRPLLAQ